MNKTKKSVGVWIAKNAAAAAAAALVLILIAPMTWRFNLQVAHAATIVASVKPTFQADLTNTLNLQAGYGLPTFVRATIATVVDWEGLLKPVLSGEARFTGARRVRNRLTDSTSGNAFGAGTGNTPTVTYNSATAPDGTQTAMRVQMALNGGNTTNDRSGLLFVIGNEGAGSVVGSVWLKANSGTPTIQFRAALGVVSITLDSTWRRYSVPGAIIVSESLYVWVRGAMGTSDSADVLVWHPQIEDVVGQSNKNPSEYVDTATTHGAGVTRVQYFNTKNGNTVASNVVTAGTGAQITSASAAAGAAAGAVDATGPLGYLAEGARTNLAHQSEDLSTTWTGAAQLATDSTVSPSGTMAADTITDSSAVAYESKQQSYLVANDAATYTFSIYVKKTSGGTSPTFGVNLSLSGGTSTGNTPRLNTDTCGVSGGGAIATSVGNYCRFSLSITNNSSGNTTLTAAIYPATAAYGSFTDTTAGTGSAIVWGAQLEAGTFASSYIPTTSASVTRNGDVLSYPSSRNIDGTKGSAYAEVNISNGINNSNPPRFITFNTSTERDALYDYVNGLLGMADGTSVAYSSNKVIVADGVLRRYASKWGSSLMQTFASGVAGNSASFDGDMNVVDTINIGTLRNSSGYELFGTIRNVKIWQKALTNTQLTTMTGSVIPKSVVPQTTLKQTGKATINASTNTAGGSLTSGLVGLWSFDGKDMNWATGTAFDRSGAGNNGSLVAMSTTTSPAIGKIGQALNFNGSTSYVDAGNGSSLNFGNGAFSISLWVKALSQSASYPALIEKGNGDFTTSVTTHTGWLFGKYISTYKFNISDNGGTAVYNVNFGNFENQGWTHLVVSMDSGSAMSPQIRAYKNGILVDTESRTYLGSLDTANNLSIGKWRMPNRFFSGSIDDVRIYNRALSATEVKALYNLGR